MNKDYCLICGTLLSWEEDIICENCEDSLDEPLEEPVRVRRKFLDEEEH